MKSHSLEKSLSNSLRSPSVRMVLAVIPSFFIWKLLHDFTIVPVTYQISQIWLAVFHSELHGLVSYSEDTVQWTSMMPLFVPNQVSDSTVFAPHTKLSGMTEVPLGALSLYSLGFPLWTVLLIGQNNASPKQIMVGFGLLVLTFALAVGLSISHSLLELLNTSRALRVFFEGYVIVPHQWPEWAAVALKPLFDVTCIFTFLVLPILVCLKKASKGHIEQSTINHK